MNNIFSEIFGCYYKTITEIVNNAPLSEDEIKEIISQDGYYESCFHLLPKIKELPFIEYKNGKYYSLLKNKIKLPISNLEKSWLKAISFDPRFKLFEDDFTRLEIEPLYDNKVFNFYDKYSDSDPFESEIYIKNFKKINSAIEAVKPVKIIYQSIKKEKITIGHYLPLKIEYSPKDDKFRCYTLKIQNGAILDYVPLNFGRILDVRNSKEICPKINVEDYIKNFDATEPVVVEVYEERNAIERFMIEFSSYKKQSEFDEERKACITKIYYKKQDETEVLIKLLSFGPTLKVLAPTGFLKNFKYRVKRQMELIKNRNF